MDAAQEMDDDGAWRRITRRLICRTQPVCQQYAKTRSRIGLQHIHDRLSGLRCLFHADRRKDAMIERIVEKQDFGWFHKDGHQRQEPIFQQDANSGTEHAEDAGHERTDEIIPQDSEDHAKDTD